jgi:hypothetical protein
MLRARVPEASVDEDRNLRPREHDVSCPCSRRRNSTSGPVSRVAWRLIRALAGDIPTSASLKALELPSGVVGRAGLGLVTGSRKSP